MKITDNLLHNQSYIKDKKELLKYSQLRNYLSLYHFKTYKHSSIVETVGMIIIYSLFLFAIAFFLSMFVVIIGGGFLLMLLAIPLQISADILYNFFPESTAVFLIVLGIVFTIVKVYFYGYLKFWTKSDLILIDTPLNATGDIVFHYNMKTHGLQVFIDLYFHEKFKEKNKYFLIPKEETHEFYNWSFKK